MKRIFTTKRTKAVGPPSFFLWVYCCVLLALSGCGETIDLYGESRMQRGTPIDEKAESRGTQYRNPKPDKEQAPPAMPNIQTDYGAADGIFMIVPPADVNPKNIEVAPDPQIITIDFQKGFSWLPAMVKVNGQIIFSERLRSNPDGFADTVSFHYDKPPARFTLIFQTMNMEETFTIDPDKGRFLGISFVNNQLKLELKDGPFFYGKNNEPTTADQ